MIEMRSQLLAARAAALFASELPTGTRPATAVVNAAIAASVHACGGTRGCVAMMAAAYGDYPETAAPRMRWALSLVSIATKATQPPEPDRELVAA
jgi:hypothetical protein